MTEKLGTDPTRKEYGPHIFRPCKLCGSCLLARLRTRVFFGSGAIDVHGPKTEKKNTGSYQFVHSYVSLRNNFADGMRSTVCTCAFARGLRTQRILKTMQ